MALNANALGLPVFEGGKPLLEQLTAERMNAICAAITSHRLGRMQGFRHRVTPWGTLLTPPSATGVDDEPGPYEVIPCSPPDGQTAAAGPWVYVSANSGLRGYDTGGAFTLDPTISIPISKSGTPGTSGLGFAAAFQLVTAKAPWHIWLEVIVSKLFPDDTSDPTGTNAQPTAQIKAGLNWNPTGLTVYPDVVWYNTNTGTFAGNYGVGSTPPVNRHQVGLAVPLAYVADPASSAIAKQFGLPIGLNMSLVQQCFSHLILGAGCYAGNGGTIYVSPDPIGPMPSDS